MRIVDLSLPLGNQTRGVKVEPTLRIATDGWNASQLGLYSHAGTHMDAPFHFLDGGRTIDQQDLAALIGPAHVVNLAPAAPRQLLTVEDLAGIADRIEPGARILLRTDWHKCIGQPQYRDHLPRVSVGLARWLVEQKVALVGVEPPSVADVNDLHEVTEVHQTLLGGGVVIVEGLAHLDRLSQPVVEFIALPLKIVGGDGSPVRAIAIEDADHANS